MLRTLVAVAPEPVIRQLVIADGADGLHGDELPLHTGIQPPAAVFPEHPVDGEEDASAVGAGQNAALGIGVHMDHIVQHRVLTFAGQTEIRKKAQPEATFGLGIVENMDFVQLGHHHAKVFFQLLRRKVDHMVSAHFTDLQHGVTSCSYGNPPGDCSRIDVYRPGRRWSSPQSRFPRRLVPGILRSASAPGR